MIPNNPPPGCQLVIDSLGRRRTGALALLAPLIGRPTGAACGLDLDPSEPQDSCTNTTSCSGTQ